MARRVEHSALRWKSATEKNQRTQDEMTFHDLLPVATFAAKVLTASSLPHL
jgi:hypothetical protein